MKTWIFFAVTYLAATAALGAGPDDILGLWKTEKGDVQLEFYRCEEKICGKIIWLNEPKYVHENDGPVGTTKVDRKIPIRR